MFNTEFELPENSSKNEFQICIEQTNTGAVVSMIRLQETNDHIDIIDNQNYNIISKVSECYLHGELIIYLYESILFTIDYFNVTITI